MVGHEAQILRNAAGFGSFAAAPTAGRKTRLSIRIASFVAIVVAPLTLIAVAAHVFH